MSCAPKMDAPVEACGCCDGVEAATPTEVKNRPGLSTLRYRIGAYPQFKESLLAGLSSARYPALASLSTRNNDDYTLGLIDAVACAADVLSFYQERLANESYLRTATERVSLQEMGKLIGYRLRPGVAAETWLAFALESPRTPPPQLPPEPGAFVTGIPTSLTLASGLKVQSVPGPDEKPQVFETVEALAARPEWNAMRALPDEDVVPGFGARETWLMGVDTQLKPGDSLLFVGAEFTADPTSNRWDLRVLSEVQADADAQRTRVAWQEPLGSVSPFVRPASPPTVYALRQRAAIFGHNAPDWPGLSDQYKAAYLGLESPRQLTQKQREEWPQFDIFGPEGSGEQMLAHVSAQDAAQALLEGLRADALSVARQGLTSLSTLGLSAGSMVQKAAALTGTVGQSGIEALKLVPGAIGQIAERVVEPMRWMVDTAVSDLKPFLQSMSANAGSTVNAVRKMKTAVTGLGARGEDLDDTTNAPDAPDWPPRRDADLPPLFEGTELESLRTDLGARVTGIGLELSDLGRAGRDLRDANAGVIDAALANVAAAVYTARMEADLQLSPRLPFASAESVCLAALATSGEAHSALPDLVVAAALSDPRPAALMLASLAPWDDIEDASIEVLAERRTALINETTEIAGGLKHLLQRPDLADSVLAGQALTARLNQTANGVGSQLFTRALDRMRLSAASGVQRAHAALLARSDLLRRGVPARLLRGRGRSTISLDRVYDGVLPHSFTVLKTPAYTELFDVTRVAEASRAEFGISGKSSLLTLRGDNLPLFALAVRETTALVQSHALPRARTPITRTVSGELIDVAGAVPGLVKDRRVIVQGTSVAGLPVAHQATLLAATVLADRTTLHITPPLPVALRRAGTVVFGNVALATHGETGAQILGAGDASQPFQRFELKRLPLTYRSASNESGVDSQLSLRVGDVEWTEKPTLYGAGPGERAYTLSTDERGRDWVVFGDGVRGARLPSGVNNVRASYRQGLGQAGNVAADKLTQLMTRPMGLKGVSNPVAAEGGTDAEPASQARRSMPLGTRTLGRAVSLLDYEDFALAFTGIAKAQARVLQLAAGPTVAITVAGQGGDPVSVGGPIWRNLLAALQSSGDPHVPIALLSYQASTFRLGLKVKRDPAYEIDPLLAAVESALRAHFAFDVRALGQPVLQSEVVAVAHGVPGVLAIDLDFLFGGTQPLAQVWPSNRTRLLASAMRVHNGVAKPAELLTLHPAAFHRLEEMT
ncbi:MAG: hypothetical protein Tsb007_30150 [Rhizobacter sp.]